MNPGSAPGRVLGHHLEDQIPDLLGKLLPSDSLSHPGDQAPVPAEAGTMPTDHGLRGDDDERTVSKRTRIAERRPKRVCPGG